MRDLNPVAVSPLCRYDYFPEATSLLGAEIVSVD